MRVDLAELREWLRRSTFESARRRYKAERVTEDFVVFAPTESTGKVMVPFEVVAEWIGAFEAGRILLKQDPREMREVAQKGSAWARQLHSFETHLAAVVKAWAKRGR